jgi:hypothetical protein
MLQHVPVNSLAQIAIAILQKPLTFLTLIKFQGQFFG